jgi:integrase
MSRAFGLRLREACLADYDRLLREGRTKWTINIQEGTKGGRKKRREVPVSDRGWEALHLAVSVRPQGSSNLVLSSEKYINLIAREIYSARRILKKHGIKGYHDARSAFACEMYFQLAGAPAPVVTGGRTIPVAADREVRRILTGMLGHGRIDVVSAYCGGSRKAPHIPEIDGEGGEGKMP